MPLREVGDAITGVLVAFFDVSHERRLQQDLSRIKTELDASYEELQSTSEELETTNEELQSTVEELETMNEELHSTNEELQTTNDELRERSDDLNRSNGLLHSILASLRYGVAVLDPELVVQIWSKSAEELWGPRSDEAVGKHFLNLDIGLPVESLKAPIRACLTEGSGYEETVVQATNRKGRSLQCRVTCTPLAKLDRQTGVLLLMEEVDAR